MLRRFLRKFFLISVPAVFIILFVFEAIVFRYVLPASEWPYRRSIQGPDDVVRYVSGRSGMYLSGVFRQGFPPEIEAPYSINSEGWNALHDFTDRKTRKIRIAVIGDSFVDCLQVGNEDCFPTQIESILQKGGRRDVEVYKFGFSGAPLSQYLHMARYVKRKYAPDIFIVNVIANDLIESMYGYDNEDGDYLQFQSTEGGWREVKPLPFIPHRARLFLKRSRIFRYFYGNLSIKFEWESFQFLLKNKPDHEFRMNVPIREVLTKNQEIRSLTSHIFKELKTLCGNGTEILVLMDGDREAIEADKDPRTEISYRLIEIVEVATSEQSIPFLSLTPVFEADFKKNRQPLQYKGDFHWNSRSHLLVAKSVVEFLQSNFLK